MILSSYNHAFRETVPIMTARLMNFVVYNIHVGGEGRADPLAEVLLAQHADVIAIVEAMTSRGDDAPLRRVACRLNMEYVSAASARDPSNAVALLSRVPIVTSIDLSVLRGRNEPVLFAHVSGGGIDLRVIVTHATIPNSALPTDFPEFDVLTGTFDAATFDVAARAMHTSNSSNGLKLSPALATFPTNRQTTGPMAGPTIAAERVYSRSKKILSSRVEMDRLAQFASDHFPLVVELEN